VLGGIFAGLLAPHLFSGTYEYPILIAAALLALPGALTGGWRGFSRDAGLVLALAALAAAARLFDLTLPDTAQLPFQVGLVAMVGLMVVYRQRPARLFALVVLSFVITGMWQPGLARVENARSFFGVHKVVETADGRHRLLFHGTTIHGAERVRDANGAPLTGRPEPLTYYYFGGPISEAIDAARAAQGELREVAAVGLGTGSLACHIRTGENWTFFEIDPEVVRIARDPARFRFLAACAPRLPVVLGDARLTLAAAPARFDLIVLDAFSSDAIPVHLLTREAFAGYLSRLSPRGMVVLHISNRHLELAKVVGAVAAAEGLVALVKRDNKANQVQNDYKANALVAVIAREASALGGLGEKRGWRLVQAGDVAAWTDDFSDILNAILRKKFGD
jgi:hypothetical protein